MAGPMSGHLVFADLKTDLSSFITLFLRELLLCSAVRCLQKWPCISQVISSWWSYHICLQKAFQQPTWVPHFVLFFDMIFLYIVFKSHYSSIYCIFASKKLAPMWVSKWVKMIFNLLSSPPSISSFLFWAPSYLAIKKAQKKTRRPCFHKHLVLSSYFQ